MAFRRASSESRSSSAGARAAIRFSAFLILAYGGITGMSVHHKLPKAYPAAALQSTGGCLLLLICAKASCMGHSPWQWPLTAGIKSPNWGFSLGLGRVRPAHNCLCKYRLFRSIKDCLLCPACVRGLEQQQ